MTKVSKISYEILTGAGPGKSDLLDQQLQGPEEGQQEEDRPQSHGEGVAQEQVGVVGTQGGDLGEGGGQDAPAVGAGPGQGEDVGEEEIAVVHVGQEEGDAHGKDHPGQKDGPAGEALPPEEQPAQHAQHQGEGGQDARPGGQGHVDRCVGGEQGVEGGGVEGEVGAVLGGLAEVDPQHVSKGLAQGQGGEDGEDAGGGEPQQVPEAGPSGHPQHRPHRQEKDGLELAGEGQPRQEGGGPWPTFQPCGQAVEAEGGVDGVALGPGRAVEDHRGQQQEQAEGGGAPVPVPGDQGLYQPAAAPGQDHIEEDGEELDKVEVGDGQIGDGGQKIEVGSGVVPFGEGYRRPAALFPEEGGPVGEEGHIVVGDVVQQQGAEQEGQTHRQQSEAHRFPPPAAQEEEPGRQQKKEDQGGHDEGPGRGLGEARRPGQGTQQQSRAAAQTAQGEGVETGHERTS